MNAVLQALFHSDQFRREVLTACSSPKRRHLAALQRVFAFLAFSERTAHSPAEFQRQALPPWFELGRQHDCSEFLRYLLDTMHEEEDASSTAVPPAPTRSQVDTSLRKPAVSARRRRHRSCGPGHQLRLEKRTEEIGSVRSLETGPADPVRVGKRH